MLLTGIGIFAFLAASSASISGILTAYITEGKQGIKKLFGGFKRVKNKPIYYLLAFIIPPVIALVAIGISTLLGNPFYTIGLTQLAAFPSMFLMITIQAGLGEEIGWRGYACPKLAERYSALNATLIIGVFWALWHVPLYFFPGMLQYEMTQQLGFFNIFIWYSIFIVATSIVHGWIYYVSDGNLWLPIILHGSLNAFGGLFAYGNLENYGGPTVLYVLIIVWVIAAVLITLIYGPKKLKRTK
ncbi:MAG: type II CAAX prenyl endopeptidase Rce1 family protein [Promethearchaeota archaeon]